MYDMRTIIAEAGGDGGVTFAVHAVLDHDPTNNGGADSAKTLYFVPGGAYRISEPIFVDVSGIVFRGEAGHVHHGSDAVTGDWGTVFTCDIGTAETDPRACITVKHPAEDTSPEDHMSIYGFRFEAITMVWGGAQPPARHVAGLRLWGNRFATVKDCRWNDFPGTSILVLDNSNPVDFENLVFACDVTEPESIEGQSYDVPVCDHAIAAVAAGPSGNSAALPDELEALSVLESCAIPKSCPNYGRTDVNNSLHISDIQVSGYRIGVYVMYSTEGTLEDSWIEEPFENAVILDSTFGWKVRGCHFVKRLAGSPLAVAGPLLSVRKDVPKAHIPDVSVSDCLFDAGCQAGRMAIAAPGTPTPTVYARPRVSVAGCTFRSAVALPLGPVSGIPYPLWQCHANQIVNQISASPAAFSRVFFGPEACMPTAGTGDTGFVNYLGNLSLPAGACIAY